MGGAFERVATAQLDLLFQVVTTVAAGMLLLAAIQMNRTNEYGADLYLRIKLTCQYLVATALAAAVLLLAVKAAVRAAEARALAAAKAFDDANDLDADHEGIGSVPAGWRRRLLRGTLVLAVALSFAASVLAVVFFEDGFLYRADHGGYGFGAPLGVMAVVIAAFVHGSFARMALTQN